MGRQGYKGEGIMGHCRDCGCRTTNGICSNCQEELFIMTYQGEYMGDEPSEEFIEKANEQGREGDKDL